MLSAVFMHVRLSYPVREETSQPAYCHEPKWPTYMYIPYLSATVLSLVSVCACLGAVLYFHIKVTGVCYELMGSYFAIRP